MPATPSAAARGTRAFTLIEVLAAVAVLAIVYTSLARAAMQGLANQGDAGRRLHASLLADRALGEVEALLAAGSAPTLGEREIPPGPDEDFAISVEVRALEGIGEALAASTPEVPAETDEDSAASPPGARGLLTAPPGQPPPLLEIVVRVSWVEGVSEQEVSRTSFAADPTRVAAALADLASGGGDGGDGDGEPDDGDSGQADPMAPGAGGAVAPPGGLGGVP